MGNQILLVDDDDALRDSFKTYLELTGNKVLDASSGSQGLELYKKHSPCMVFSDVKMNGMDGYELFSKIRDFDSKAKVVLITGHENVAKSIIAKNNGLLDVVTKPIITESLNTIIKKENC